MEMSNFKAQADAYARAAGLKPLKPSDGQELRIWAESFRGTVRGIVIASSGVNQFVTTELYNKNYTGTVRAAQATPNAKEFPIAPVLGLLGDLEKYDGRFIENLFATDGFVFLVEGTTAGRRFAFFAVNPKSSGDEASELVMKVLGLMPGVSLDAP